VPDPGVKKPTPLLLCRVFPGPEFFRDRAVFVFARTEKNQCLPGISA
jgi:hypothetical protein